MRHLKSMIILQAKHMVSRSEFKFALTLMLVIVTAAFIEVCVRFQGKDVGELPSAAAAWIGNADTMQVQSIRILVFFLVFIIGSSVFADNFYSDKKSGILYSIVTRTSIKTYVASSIIVIFAGAFFVIFVPLALSQLLAFIVFPASATEFVAFNWPSYMSSANFESPIFPDLFYNHPYFQNVLFLVNISSWAGIMALLAFAISLYTQKSRLIVLCVPTTIVLLTWFILPQNLALFGYLYPTVSTIGRSAAFFFAAPPIVLAVVFALILLAVERHRDFML